MNKALAIVVITLNLIGIIFGSFIIDKPRKPFTAGSYVFALIASSISIYLLWSAYL